MTIFVSASAVMQEDARTVAPSMVCAGLRRTGSMIAELAVSAD